MEHHFHDGLFCNLGVCKDKPFASLSAYRKHLNVFHKTVFEPFTCPFEDCTHTSN